MNIWRRIERDDRPPDPPFQFEAFFEAVERTPRSLLMLDYDGTLAPFRKNPARAVPYAGIPAALRSIAETGRTRVVIISGRDAYDVISLLNIAPQPEVWGFHGLQRLRPNGKAESAPLDEHTINALNEARNLLLLEHLDHVVEFKAGSIAVHWRGMAEAEARSVRDCVFAIWTPLADSTGLRVMEFDGGVEIRAPGPDKGDAVLTVLNEMSNDTPAAYLGDDTTDESAFHALDGRGLSVLVRPRLRQTAAQLWLQPPQEILGFFARWLEACRKPRSHLEKGVIVNQ